MDTLRLRRLQTDFPCAYALQKVNIVPIPGTRKLERLVENGKAAEILLTEQEISKLERALEEMDVSEMFGGSKIKEKEKG